LREAVDFAGVGQQHVAGYPNTVCTHMLSGLLSNIPRMVTSS
jgi:hypothetical protein